MPGEQPAPAPAPRTPDRIAADNLIARALVLDRSGYADEAQALRHRAVRLLGGSPAQLGDGD